MKIIEFKASGKMGEFYNEIHQKIILVGGEFGFVGVKEHFKFENKELTYTVNPFDPAKTINLDGYPQSYADITVTNSKGEMVDDVDKDVVAAISLLNGCIVTKVNGSVIWVYRNNKRSLIWILAKYVGIATAIIVVAGLAYVGYKAVTE